MTASYTDSSASDSAYDGDTRSWGAGIYASGLSSSGAYFDLIAKYVYHDNLRFAGAGNRDFHSRSLYAGAETGYRFSLNDTLFIEPQAELVYGHISGNDFNWTDNGMAVAMSRDDADPLVGRTGVAMGKTFAGKAWRVTARAGGKDGHMLMNLGINAQLGDNTRIGLQVERSAFGVWRLAFGVWRLAFGVWRLAFGVWRLANIILTIQLTPPSVTHAEAAVCEPPGVQINDTTGARVNPSATDWSGGPATGEVQENRLTAVDKKAA